MITISLAKYKHIGTVRVPLYIVLDGTSIRYNIPSDKFRVICPSALQYDILCDAAVVVGNIDIRVMIDWSC